MAASGGLQQRASICRALVTTRRSADGRALRALDAMTREKMNLSCSESGSGERKGVLLITQYLESISSDRVLVMTERPGRIAAVQNRPAAAAHAVDDG
jgi:ABC-type nitrate/sulfonate/bicarbonate transport system ATPase subunit